MAPPLFTQTYSELQLGSLSPKQRFTSPLRLCSSQHCMYNTCTYVAPHLPNQRSASHQQVSIGPSPMLVVISSRSTSIYIPCSASRQDSMALNALGPAIPIILIDTLIIKNEIISIKLPVDP